MLPVALLVGLDAVTMLSLHRPKLVVMCTEMHHHQRRLIADLAAKVGGRIASVAEKASPANVEHLIEGFAAVSFAPEQAEPRIKSGTRSRVRPGEYHLEAPKIEVVGSKKR